MASDFELGGAEMDPSPFDTQEMRVHAGGDADTGVIFPEERGTSAPSEQGEQTPFPEGQEFPSQFDYGPD